MVLNASLRHLRDGRSRLLRTVVSKRLERGRVGSVDDTRFTEEDLLVLQGMYSGAASSGSGSSELNMEALHVPPLPDEDGRWATMKQDFFRRPCHQFEHAWWLAPLAYCRDALTAAAVCFGDPVGGSWFLFSYAMLDPLQLSLVPLLLVDAVEPPDMGFDVCVVCTSQLYRWTLCAEDHFVFKHEFEMAARATDDVWVLPQLCQDGSFSLASWTL